MGSRARVLRWALREDRRERAGQIHRDDVEGEAQRENILDFFRNGKGATFVAPYSTRARANAPVAMPITWDELDENLKPNQFSLDSALARLDKIGDAWAPMLAKPQRMPP